MLESSGTKSSFLFLKSCPSSYPSDHPLLQWRRSHGHPWDISYKTLLVYNFLFVNLVSHLMLYLEVYFIHVK